jgi:hypothetical protein
MCQSPNGLSEGVEYYLKFVWGVAQEFCLRSIHVFYWVMSTKETSYMLFSLSEVNNNICFAMTPDTFYFVSASPMLLLNYDNALTFSPSMYDCAVWSYLGYRLENTSKTSWIRFRWGEDIFLWSDSVRIVFFYGGLLLNMHNFSITLFSFKTYFISCFNHSNQTNQTDW